jgi:phasin
MTTSTKSKPTNHTVQFHDTIEASAERSKEALETLGTAANEAAQAMQECCSTSLKGMQDYSGKVAEFTQANIKSYVEFVQKLASVKSPSEFIEVSTSHTRDQMEALAAQGKQLTALAQKVTLDAVEPLGRGFAKVPITPR